MAVGFTRTDFQAEPSILDSFRTILMILARLENQVWAKAWPGNPNQACRFQNVFLGPIPAAPGKPSLGLSRHNFMHLMEIKKNVGSVGSILFLNFLEMRITNCRIKFRNGAQKKKFRNLQAWLGVPGEVWPRHDFQARPKALNLTRMGSIIDGLV